MRGLERAQTRDYMREIERGKAKQKLCVKPLARCRARNKQSRCWLKDWAAGDVLLRICGFLQMLYCVQPFLFITFLSFPQVLLLVSVLPLLSSLNLSEYSHEYLATTSFYKHPLVYPSSLLTMPEASVHQLFFAVTTRFYSFYLVFMGLLSILFAHKG